MISVADLFVWDSLDAETKRIAREVLLPAIEQEFMERHEQARQWRIEMLEDEVTTLKDAITLFVNASTNEERALGEKRLAECVT